MAISIRQARERLSTYSLLYVEDEEGLRTEMEEYLRALFGSVYSASHSEEALSQYVAHRPLLALIDITLPGKSGLDIAREIRQNDKIIRLMLLTGRSDTEALLEAVELNLSRYFIKPSSREALLEGLMKCCDELDLLKQATERIVLDKECYYDKTRAELILHSQPVKLTKSELILLELLIDAKGHIVSGDLISATVWPSTPPSIESIRSLMRNLRKKLPENLIVTHSGIGYAIKYP